MDTATWYVPATPGHNFEGYPEVTVLFGVILDYPN